MSFLIQIRAAAAMLCLAGMCSLSASAQLSDKLEALREQRDYWQLERVVPFRLAETTVEATLGKKKVEVRVLSHFPAPAHALRGVIFFFHGGGGDVTTWVSKSVEGSSLVAAAVDRGYGVVCVESVNRPRRGWNWGNHEDPHQTAWDDENMLRTVYGTFLRLGKYSAGTGIYLCGASGGGNCVFTMGLRLKKPGGTSRPGPIGPRVPVKAVGVYINLPDLPHAELLEYTTPTIFVHASRDPNNPAEQVAAFRSRLELILKRNTGRSGLSEIYRHQPRPLARDRMARVPGVSYALSRRIYRELREPGHLGPDGEPLSSAYAAVRRMTYLNLSQIRQVTQQLDAVNAHHALMSEFHEQVLAFFDRQR